MPLKPTMGHLDPKSDRAKDWLEVYGSLEVPLESPIPERAFGPFGDVNTYYKIDLKKLTEEQLEKAIAFIAKRFDVPLEEVREGVLGDVGIPVLADDVTVSFDARLTQ